jgi:threonine dehydrogenase-like Zn-dependent dehydrogenase
MAYMLATGRAAVEVVARGDDRGLRDGEVRVEVAWAGICHSDTGRISEGQGPFPTRLGHELAGTVVESAAAGLEVGARVACYTKDGYADEVVITQGNAVPIDANCTLLDGALAEPLACVIGGIDQLELVGVSEITLVGAGFMGLLAVGYLASAGHRVRVIEPRERARALALELGAISVDHPDEVTVKPERPLVLEATGSASGLALAGDLTGTAGTLGVLGYHQTRGGRRDVDMKGWNFRALRVLNLHHREPHDVLRWMDRAQRASARGSIRPSQLVDEFVTLDDLPAYFATDAHGDVIKTVVRLQGASD